MCGSGTVAPMLDARRHVLVAIAFAVLAVATPARAETPAETARALIARYHEDPARIDRARELLEAALQQERAVPTMVTLARVQFLWGDIRARTPDEKLAAYDRGRELGRRAIELAPRDVQAHLWYAINTGRWGQTKGIMRSLFLLPTVREEIDVLLALDPKLPATHSLAGNVFLEVPGIFGGDRAKAEEHFRKGLATDPHYTVLRIDLARVLIATGRYADARRELARVAEEPAPTNLADWTVKDRPRAHELLHQIRDRK